MLRRLEARRPPSCRRHLEYVADGLYTMLEKTASGVCTRRACFIADTPRFFPEKNQTMEKYLPREDEGGERDRTVVDIQSLHNIVIAHQQLMTSVIARLPSAFVRWSC